MAGARGPAHRAAMVDIIVLACTALAFVGLAAAVPLALRESRQDEDRGHAKR